MSDYTPSGNPATSAAGTSVDIRTEFGLIQTAIATKLDSTGSTNITTLGTITTGTWNGTDIAVADGGTGRSTSTTAYGLLAAGTTATGAHQTLAAGATTDILVGGGASALPVWTAATGSGAPVRKTGATLETPALGVATATSINGLTLPVATDTVACLGTLQTFTKSQRGTLTTDNDGSFDMNVTNNFKCTTAGAFALTFTNITSGQSGNILFINASNHAITAAATTKVPTGLLATISVTGTYLLGYFSDGTNVYVAGTSALS